jgi:hypothetical protein
MKIPPFAYPIIVVAIFVALILFMKAGHVEQDMTAPEYRARVESYTGPLPWPDSIEWRHCFLKEGFYPYFAARVLVPEPDLDAFVKSLGGGAWDDETRHCRNNQHVVGWYLPERQSPHRGTTIQLPPTSPVVEGEKPERVFIAAQYRPPDQDADTGAPVEAFIYWSRYP